MSNAEAQVADLMTIIHKAKSEAFEQAADVTMRAIREKRTLQWLERELVKLAFEEREATGVKVAG